MLRMFAIVHAQSHSGTKGKVVKNDDGSIAGYEKNGAVTYTKKNLRKVNAIPKRGGNTGTGGNGRG